MGTSAQDEIGEQRLKLITTGARKKEKEKPDHKQD